MTLPTAPQATRREWIGLAVIALPCFVYAMDMTVLNLALPAISAQLQPTASQLLWMVDIYGFFVAGFLITMGNLGDRIGRRRLLLIGAAAFGLASIVAAFSSSAEMLVAMRALLGVAGATVAPSTMSLIRTMFADDRQRQFAIGVWIASFSAGSAVGPLIGGVLLQFFWWGSVFLVAVPVMALLLLLGPKLLPEYRDPQAGPIDLVSAGMSLAAILAVVFALKQLAEHGFAWAPSVLLALGLALGALFVRRQGRLGTPLVDTGLFAQARFSAAIAAYGLSCLAMFGVFIFVAQYLQLVLGLSPLAAGVATVPWSLGFVAGSLAAPRLARRWTPESVLVWGLGAAAIGFGLLAMVDGRWGLVILVAATVVMSLGLSPVFTVGNELIITAAPHERAGAASALAETAAELSGALGIGLVGSLGMLHYRHQLDAGLPDGVAQSLAAAVGPQALATLGGALSAAQSLPVELGQALRLAARAGFVDALQLAAVVGGVVVVLAGVIVVRLLRGPALSQAHTAKSGAD